MKKPFHLYASTLLTLAIATSALARAGGGCFEEGTPIITPRGEVSIEQLHVGDEIVGGVVQSVIRVEPESYLELTRNGRTLHVTGVHPFQVAPGVFREASRLPGAHRIPATRPAYNLLVSPGGTYIAAGSIVHNKGCFLADTPILRADGSEIWIRDIQPGEELLAFTRAGEVVTGTVLNVITHQVDEYLIVSLERCKLHVTVEHPFYVGDGTFKTLEALTIGDTVYAYDGQGIRPQRIESIERVRSRVRVYNLQTDAPNTYFANRIAVHNKGGCFAAGTLIRTPRGDVPIQQIRPGDEVLSGDGQTVLVHAAFVTRAPVLTLHTSAGDLRTTAEHPVLCRDNQFRDAGVLYIGDRIINQSVGGVSDADWQHHPKIESIETGPPALVYNLSIAAPHTFVADGFVVHNKGGCFPAGVLVTTPSGPRQIETLAVGDEVLAVTEGGQSITTRVRRVYETSSPLLILRFADGTILRTTDEHPLSLANGKFLPAADTSVGAAVRVWRRDRIETTKIVTRNTDPQFIRVYNLEVGAPHTFIAEGVVVHNKGGFGGGRGFGGGGYRGGGGRYVGGGGGGRPMEKDDWMVIGGVVGAAGLIVVLICLAPKKDENLDFCYPRTAINKKAFKTRTLLNFIAKTDTTFTPATLEERARTTFMFAQKNWEARDYLPMRKLMMPDLFAAQSQQLAGLLRNHEINVIADLDVENVDIVNVRYTHKPNDREFTALITAKARDYYIDDQTRDFIRGDRKAARFQEFWTYQWQDGAWLVREIEQTRESDALKDENFFEQFTDTGRDQIYGEEAGKEGPAGPWLEKDVATKATRIERMLNFLVQTDKIWNRQKMIQRARDVFTKVILARESGNVADIPTSDLSADLAAALRQEIESRRAACEIIEFRNFCIRKAELILIRNYLDRAKDEFSARISAHAQKIVLQNGETIRADEYVSPFEAFCVFTRAGNQWNLKEILPPGRGKDLLSQENLDEDSTPDQVQWYYKQTRAN
jgi:uncharacterized membrane protein YgcG